MGRPLKNYPKRECDICGDRYKPYRHDAPTCGKTECKQKYRKSYVKDYNRNYYLMNIKDSERGEVKAAIRNENQKLEYEIEETERRKREDRERKDREREIRLNRNLDMPLPFGSSTIKKNA